MTNFSGTAPPSDVTFIVNAFTGDQVVSGTLAQQYAPWSLTNARVGAFRKLLPAAVNPADWSDEKVGWGIILPEPPNVSESDADALARADDAPAPIRELIASRQGKVLRYRASSDYASWTLRDYAGGGDLLTAASPPGSGPRQLPMYLLIYANPEQVPWHVQYTLNPVRHVGRLDLEGDQLANYVSALIKGWPNSQARYGSPVLWSVDLGGGDITTLMRNAISAPLYGLLSGDPDIPDAQYIDGSITSATGHLLAQAVAESAPLLVVTTSHGMTGPLHDREAMRNSLGVPVDQSGGIVHPNQVLASWQPDGAIWFAQACCSAGADSPSSYRGLFQEGSMLERVLDAVADIGAMTAPLPRALLGSDKPLRAFIGQVEPTFNWTMSFPPNRQRLTSDIQMCLYNRLCLGQPIGLAMSPYYQAIGSLLLNHDRAVVKYDVSVKAAARGALDLALYSKVTAYDRASTVILGDPTAAMPLPEHHSDRVASSNNG